MQTDTATHKNLGKLAVMHAIFEVAHGIGQTESDKRLDALQNSSAQRRKESLEAEKRELHLEEQIQQEMHRLNPQISVLHRAFFEQMLTTAGNPSTQTENGIFGEAFTSYFDLLRELRPIAEKNLGITPESR